MRIGLSLSLSLFPPSPLGPIVWIYFLMATPPHLSGRGQNHRRRIFSLFSLFFKKDILLKRAKLVVVCKVFPPPYLLLCARMPCPGIIHPLLPLPPFFRSFFMPPPRVRKAHFRNFLIPPPPPLFPSKQTFPSFDASPSSPPREGEERKFRRWLQKTNFLHMHSQMIYPCFAPKKVKCLCYTRY